MAEARELLRDAPSRRPVCRPTHELYWALFELGWAHYYPATSDGAIAACEESSASTRAWRGATMPTAGGGPGWGLGVALFERGEIERGAAIMRGLGDDDLSHTMPVEKCFDWESLALVEIARGQLGRRRTPMRAAPRSTPRRSTSTCPRRSPRRTRAEVLMAQGEPARGGACGRRVGGRVRTAAGARLQAAFSRGLAGQALAAAGEREEAIAALRAAERELDDCGSHPPARRAAPRAAQARRALRGARAGDARRLGDSRR